MVRNFHNEIIEEIGLVCRAFKLNKKIEDEAVNIITKYQEREGLKGRNIEHYAAGAVFLACKRWNYPMTATAMNDVLECNSEYSHTKGSLIIARTAKHISRVNEDSFQPVSVDKYVDILQAKVQSFPDGCARATFIIDWMEKHNINIGNNYPALAATISYIADRMTGHRVSEREYAKSIGTTEVSIRNYKRKLLKAIPNIKKKGTLYRWEGDMNENHVL